MKIELTPLQMAILAQVFARDAVALEDRINEPTKGVHYDAVLLTRQMQSDNLRSAINGQLTAADQRAIGEVSHGAA